ncbi:MAG: DUF3467 domain-containing protein [Deltaproteobacteria bacterium]|nr:DUF3467 domain-containing protein [Deltaproteobacteria bacterium]
MTPPKSPPRFTDPLNLAPGRFATMINIGHTREFFALDLHAATPQGEVCLLGRYFLTPGHAKRLYTALGDNLAAFEKQHGAIDSNMNEPPPDPSTN